MLEIQFTVVSGHEGLRDPFVFFGKRKVVADAVLVMGLMYRGSN